MTSWPPCWWTKIKDLSLASFVRPPKVVHFTIVIGVSIGWLKTSYTSPKLKSSRPHHVRITEKLQRWTRGYKDY